MIAIALITLRSERAPKMPPPLLEPETNSDPLGAELARCATITVPDTACEAVWTAHRHRFFGEGNAAAGSAPADNAIVVEVDPGTAATADGPLP